MESLVLKLKKTPYYMFWHQSNSSPLIVKWNENKHTIDKIVYRN